MSVHAWITRDAIEPQDVLARAGDARDGAVLLFLGTVREQNEGRAVTGMHYDAYEKMAEEVLADIVREAAERSGSDRIVAVHRIGELRIGDVSVAIAVSTPHRAEAFDATRHIIEEIKRRLPVWKHERYVEGAPAWLAGAVPPATQ